MKICFILAFVLCTNLIHCSTTEKPLSATTVSKLASVPTTTPVVNNSKNLHRVRLVSSKDDGKQILPFLENLAVTTSSNDAIKPNDGSNCIVKCKNYYGFAVADIEKSQSCVNGCRHMTNSKISLENKPSVSDCSNSCKKLYANDTNLITICNFGCRLANTTDNQEIETPPIESIPIVNEPKKIDSSKVDGENNEKRSFSMFIPIRTLTSTNEMVDNRSPQNLDDFFGSNNRPSSLSQIMMSMVRSMAERARQMMEFARSQQQKLDDDRLSMDFDSASNSLSGNGDGEAVSLERSMSVIMTNGDDGQKKIVVMREPPKITIHHGWNPLGLDFNRFNNERANNLNQHMKQLEREQQERFNKNKFKVLVPWKWSDDWDHRFPSFGLSPPSSNQQNKNNLDHNVDDDDVMVINTVDHNKSESKIQWSSCLISMMPLVYLLMVILLLYVIIWLFYSVPNYVICRNRRNSGSVAENRRPKLIIVPNDDKIKPEKSLMFYDKLLSFYNRPRGYSVLFGNVDKIPKSAPIFIPATNPSKSAVSQPAPPSMFSPSESTLSFPPPYSTVLADSGARTIPSETMNRLMEAVKKSAENAEMSKK